MSDESHHSKYVKTIDKLSLYNRETVIVYYVMPEPQSDQVLLDSHINFQACSLPQGVDKGDAPGYQMCDSW